MYTRLTSLLYLVLAISCLTACKTTRGLGRDIQHLGAKIEEEAAENTKY